MKTRWVDCFNISNNIMVKNQVAIVKITTCIYIYDMKVIFKVIWGFFFCLNSIFWTLLFPLLIYILVLFKKHLWNTSNKKVWDFLSKKETFIYHLICAGIFLDVKIESKINNMLLNLNKFTLQTRDILVFFFF